MAMHTTRDAFLYALGEIYDGENHLLDAQQHMFEHAADAELLGILRPHIAQTERHVMALDGVFRLLNQEPKGVTCHPASGLGDGARQEIGDARTEAVRDYVIARAAVQVEHFEIASYHALIAEARGLGLLDQVLTQLWQNLRQDQEMVDALIPLTRRLLQTALMREGEQPPERSRAAGDDPRSGARPADTYLPSQGDGETGAADPLA